MTHPLHQKVTANHLRRDAYLYTRQSTWDQFEANQGRLRDNAQAHGSERRKSPLREGPALLQGLVVCGVCGQRMTVRYHTRKGRQWPEYLCQREAIDAATAKCQTIVPDLCAQVTNPINRFTGDGAYDTRAV